LHHLSKEQPNIGISDRTFLNIYRNFLLLHRVEKVGKFLAAQPKRLEMCAELKTRVLNLSDFLWLSIGYPKIVSKNFGNNTKALIKMFVTVCRLFL
jgi:hypothetical protein